MSRWSPRRSHRSTFHLVAAAAGSLLCVSGVQPLRAQANPEAASIEQLNRTIGNLERRVRELERQLEALTAEPAPAPGPPPEPTDLGQVLPPPVVPAPAPGQVEVSPEAAATALERALVERGAAVLPPGGFQVEPSLSFASQQEDVPAFLVEDDGGFRRRQDVLTAGLGLRLGLPYDTQLTLGGFYQHVGASLLSRSPADDLVDESRSISGFGDIGVSLSKHLLREEGWRPDLVAALRWDTDTGATLGSGFHAISPSLTASISQDPLVFVGGLSYTHTFEDDDIKPGPVYGLSLGTVLAASPETSLRFFFDQFYFERTEIDGRALPGTDGWVGLLSIGASTILSPRVLLDAQLGVGLNDNAPDYVFTVSLPIRVDLPLFSTPPRAANERLSALPTGDQ